MSPRNCGGSRRAMPLQIWAAVVHYYRHKMSPKPNVSLDQVSSILQQHYHLHVLHVEELLSYDCRNFSVTKVPAGADNAEKDNPAVRTERGQKQIKDDEDTTVLKSNGNEKFVLKVFNEDTCTEEGLLKIEAQIMCSQHLLQKGFLCPKLVPTHEGKTLARFGEKRYAQLMTFLPGKHLGVVTNSLTARVLYELGILLSKMHQALSKRCDICFSMGHGRFWELEIIHVNLDTYMKKHACFSRDHLEVNSDSPWALENMHLLSSYLHCIQDEEEKALLSEIITTFSKIVSEKRFCTFKKGIIHGDFHDYNIIVDWDSDKQKPDVDEAAFTPSELAAHTDSILQKYAIIDFEEMSFSYPALELSRLIADMMIDYESVNLLEIGGHVIAGYMTVDTAVVAEFPYVYETALTCLAQYIVLKTHEKAVQGSDNEWYVMLGVAPSQKVLEKVRSTKASEVYRIWADVLRKYNLKNPFHSRMTQTDPL